MKWNQYYPSIAYSTTFTLLFSYEILDYELVNRKSDIKN